MSKLISAVEQTLDILTLSFHSHVSSLLIFLRYLFSFNFLFLLFFSFLFFICYIVFDLSLRTKLPTKSSKVAAGLEPENTNLLLQKLAEAATSGKGKKSSSSSSSKKSERSEKIERSESSAKKESSSSSSKRSSSAKGKSREEEDGREWRKR